MSPNLVLQQLISDRNSTPISTFEASMVASQSMINDLSFFIHWNGMKWICTTKIIPAIYLNSFLPNSTPSETAFHRSNPTISLWGASSGSSGFLFSEFLSSGDLIWSRCRVNKRKVGGATGPQVGEKVNAQPVLEAGGKGFLLRFYSILFLQKSPRNRFSWNVNSSRFPVEYTRCHILYSPPIYESKFGVPTSDFTPQKQTITKHVHIHSWSLHDSMVDSQSMVNGKYFFSYIEMDLYNQYLIPTISRHAAAQQVGFNSFPPNSAVPTLPLQSEKHHLAWWRTWSGVGPGVKIQIRRIVNQYNQIGMVLASKRSWKTLK